MSPLPDSFRAAVFRGAGQALAIEQFAPPSLEPGELLVRIRCCTLCGSDLHSYFGRRTTPCPTILGHEIVGEILDLPEDEKPCDFLGNPLQRGDRVSWSVMASCGKCERCTGGLPQKCLSLFKYGHQRLDESTLFSGGLADVCHLHRGTTICRVPERLTDEVAAMANCAGATAAAAFRLAGPSQNRTVLIQGAGALGLLACAMAREGGARSVLVTDAVAERAEQAQQFGAAATMVVGEDDLPDFVRRTGGEVDIALEMSGAPEALESGLPVLALGGVYVLVGGALPSRPAGVAMERVVRNLLTIRGVHNYWPEDLDLALRFLHQASNRYPFADLVGERFELAEATEAFDHAEKGRSCRVAVVPRAFE